jgi:YD repeat-containing protein
VRPHAVLTAGSNQYSYDLNGNMTQRVEVSGTQRITYTQGWDVENRLIAVTATTGSAISVTQFVYDGDGSRVLQLLPDGSQTAYAGSLEVQITATQRTHAPHKTACGAVQVSPRRTTRQEVNSLRCGYTPRRRAACYTICTGTTSAARL